MHRNKRKPRTKLSESAQAHRVCKRSSEPPSEEIGDRRNAKGQKKRKNSMVLSHSVGSFQRLDYNQPAKETCRSILIFLLNKQAATFVEIVQASHKSPATTSYTLKQLVHNNVIKKIPGFQKKYALCDPQLTKHLLDELDITPIDTMADRFADSFSYY